MIWFFNGFIFLLPKSPHFSLTFLHFSLTLRHLQLGRERGEGRSGKGKVREKCTRDFGIIKTISTKSQALNLESQPSKQTHALPHEASVRLGHKSLRTLMKRSSSWYLPGERAEREKREARQIVTKNAFITETQDQQPAPATAVFDE